MDIEDADLRYGVENIQYIRKRTSVPLIVFSSAIIETAMIMSLNIGAYDYVSSSENPLVILARVKAQLRRYTELKTQKTQKMLLQYISTKIESNPREPQYIKVVRGLGYKVG